MPRIIDPPASETDRLERPHSAPWLASLLSTGLIGLCAVVYGNAGGTLEAVRLIDRLTIRVAAVLFSLTFAASSSRALFPGKVSGWLFSHRRNLTIAFAVAFTLHLGAVARFHALDESAFWAVSPPLLIVLRGIGVAFVVLMMLDALTGRLAGRWQLVSAFGAYYVWGAFVVGFAKRIALDPCSSLPLALLVLALIPNLLTARLVGTRK